MNRRLKWFVLLLALAVPLAAASTGGAAIAPPWCGTPEPDAAANLPDGSSPAHPAGSFPHIPYYAIGCTLDSIAAASGGRMTVERFGHSATGRDKFLVVINALDTKSQRRDYANWQKIRRSALEDPERAQDILDRAGDDVKVPLYIQGGIHGNEYEGVDAAMQVIEKLATTPYGTDPEVDQILDQAIVIFNPIQNPDGRIAGTRANGNGFDLNRDFMTQSQPETQTSVAIMQEWLPPEMLDLHGYVSPTLIEATTKPHNPGIEYDMWLKWNQSRIDANEAAMNAQGFNVTRPINDWCADGSIPQQNPSGLCDDGTDRIGPRWAESWDDWGPFYSPMYSQLVGLNGSTVEMCNNATLNPSGNICGPGANVYDKVGRSGARMHQVITVWSSLLFDTENRVELLDDLVEIYIRNDNDAPRPTTADLAPQTPGDPTDVDIPPGFDNDENNWMIDYPQAFVIPKGDHQRSDPEARRLVRWLLANGIQVRQLKKGYQYDATTRFEQDSWVVFMDQPLRGLAYTSLGAGQDVSSRISILYAPPGAWSHGYLWGADVVEVPDSATFDPKTERVRKVWNALRWSRRLAERCGVRARDRLADRGPDAERPARRRPDGRSWRLLRSRTRSVSRCPPAPCSSRPAPARRSKRPARTSGLWFIGVRGSALPPVEAIDRSPRIAVLTGAVNQDVWVLRNLGFTADPVSTALINSAPTDPLVNYDVVFNTGNWPPASQPTARARLTAFFAGGGGYTGANANGANFLVAAGQVTGLAAASNSGGGSGYSGIVNWNNSASGTGLITGAYESRDTAIMDPPTWFTGVPASWTADGSLPLTGFFLSGLWPLDAASATAPGAAVIAHGLEHGGQLADDDLRDEPALPGRPGT